MDDVQREAALDALEDDDDRYELSDTVTLRLKSLPDDGDPFQETDTYGQIADAEYRGSYPPRPDGFDGNAEKMWLQQNGGCVWWQPPADVKRTDDGFKELRDLVNDIASFGHHGLVLEWLEGSDAYGRPIVRFSASLWGLEPFLDNAYRRTIVGELLGELEYEVEKKEE